MEWQEILASPTGLFKEDSPLKNLTIFLNYSCDGPGWVFVDLTLTIQLGTYSCRLRVRRKSHPLLPNYVALNKLTSNTRLNVKGL